MSQTLLKSNNRSRINPQLFALWISMASICMMFGAFSSAYIVRKAAGNWLEFTIPNVFFVSTIVILLSSLSLHNAFIGFKKGRESRYKNLLVVSLVLGIAFLVLQYIGWNQLFNLGVDLKGNPSGAFFYVITGVHAAHILGGIGAIVMAILHAFTLPYKVTEKRRNRFELVVHYWHFVDILWIYLLVFLLMSR